MRFQLSNLILLVVGLITQLGAGPLQYTGVNISGGEFDSPKPGVRSVAFKNFIYPSKKEIHYFRSIGMNVIRVPFHWETIEPTLSGGLDSKELDRLADTIKAITDEKCVALLDVHNYARYYGKVVGGPDVPSAAFADFWSKMSDRFKDNPLVWFGLMNEPHSMPAEQWLTAANDSIAAIRKTGSTNLILVPGISWSGAHSWESSGNAKTMLGIVDSADAYVIEVHQYLDVDSSGSKPIVVSPTIGSERIKGFTDWCRLHHRKAFLGEFGAPANAQGKVAIEDMLKSMQDNADVWTGFTWWSAGAWWGDYMFSIEPKKDGTDAGQVDYLRPFLQPGCRQSEITLNTVYDLIMPTLATTVDGIKLPNPFVIGSGPPGTNANVIGKAFDEGWGAVVIKTISLESDKVTNVAPRYARLRTEKSKEIIGWQNIELISDRPFSVWLDELKMLKDKYPDGVVIASIMEEYRKDAWIEIVERVQATGVAGFELNFSCPHGLPERKMGAAMGQDNSIMNEVCGWVMSAARIPVWAKLTPNVTSIAAGAEAALSAGCQGVAAINTILCVMGVDLETLRPEPTVEGYTVPGGYSCTAVKPIALRMVKDCAEMIRDKFPSRSLSAIGGIESGKDAAQFILMGGDTVQVCTGVMKMGYDCVKPMQEELLAFMAKHKFETISDFKGHSLQYFTTHADLVRRQKEAKDAAKAKSLVSKDGQWKGDDFVKQTESLAR